MDPPRCMVCEPAAASGVDGGGGVGSGRDERGWAREAVQTGGCQYSRRGVMQHSRSTSHDVGDVRGKEEEGRVRGEGRRESERGVSAVLVAAAVAPVTHSSSVRLLPASAAAMALVPVSPIELLLKLYGGRAIDRWTHRDAWYEPAVWAEAEEWAVAGTRGVGQERVQAGGR
jgi:hypothetical protein